VKKTTKPRTAAKKPTAPKRVPRVNTRSAVIAPFVPTPEQFSVKYHDVEDTKIPKAAWEDLLNEISERGNITDSCKVVGIKRITHYKRCDRDEEYAKRAEAAHKQGLKQLEDHAVKRAIRGVDKPVFFQGVEIARVTEYSDSLLQFLLQSNDPKYKRKQEITGADGGPLALLVQLTDDELDAEIAKLRKDAGELAAE
jgi:hypothetical protein